MKWTDAQLQKYHEQGFLFMPGLISSQKVAEMQAAVPLLLNSEEESDGMHREREKGGAVRQVYLAHRYTEAFRDLTHNPKILDSVTQILNNDAYVWHSKLNVKDAFEGTVWLWHQDYGYWMWDGVEPKLVSVMVFLDQSTIHNGCFMVVAGSHKWGRQEHYLDEVTTSYKQWCIDVETLKGNIKEEQIQAITGEPGDVCFFDCNLVHGSGHNMSPLPRKVFILAYNDIDNKPRPVKNPRLDWVVSRIFDKVH